MPCLSVCLPSYYSLAHKERDTHKKFPISSLLYLLYSSLFVSFFHHTFFFFSSRFLHLSISTSVFPFCLFKAFLQLSNGQLLRALSKGRINNHSVCFIRKKLGLGKNKLSVEDKSILIFLFFLLTQPENCLIEQESKRKKILIINENGLKMNVFSNSDCHEQLPFSLPALTKCCWAMCFELRDSGDARECSNTP
jgi:hypothetical protein